MKSRKGCPSLSSMSNFSRFEDGLPPCHHASKGGEDPGECINECRNDICEVT